MMTELYDILCPGKFYLIIVNCLEIDARRNAVRKHDETYWDMMMRVLHSSCNKQLGQVASRLMSTATAAAYKALTRLAFLNTFSQDLSIPNLAISSHGFHMGHFEKLGHLWDEGHQCQVMQSQEWSTSNSSAYMDSQDVVTALCVSLRTLKCSCGKITQNESCSPNFSGAHHRYQKQVSVRMSLLVVALASDLIFYEDISVHSPKPTSNPLRVLASAWSMFHRCTSGLAWNVVL